MHPRFERNLTDNFHNAIKFMNYKNSIKLRDVIADLNKNLQEILNVVLNDLEIMKRILLLSQIV